MPRRTTRTDSQREMVGHRVIVSTQRRGREQRRRWSDRWMAMVQPVGYSSGVSKLPIAEGFGLTQRAAVRDAEADFKRKVG